MACRDVVKERGLDRITVEDLVQVTEIKESQLVNKCLHRILPHVAARWCLRRSGRSF